MLCGVRQVLLQVELVWVSHMHADHHLGLPALLEARARLAPGAKPLLVVGPNLLQTWLRRAAAALHAPVAFNFVYCGHAPTNGSVNIAIRRLGFEWLQVSPVHHSMDSWAIGLQHHEGWSLVYSGDTRPCDGVVRLGRSMRPSARILVHE